MLWSTVKFWYGQPASHSNPIRLTQVTFVEHPLGSGHWARSWGDKRAGTQGPLRYPLQQKGGSGHGVRALEPRGRRSEEASGKISSVVTHPRQTRKGKTLQGGGPAKTVASKTLKRRLRSWALAFNQWGTTRGWLLQSNMLRSLHRKVILRWTGQQRAWGQKQPPN